MPKKRKPDPRLAYSEKVAGEILDRMAAGESLTQICRDDVMPNRHTVLRWQDGERGAPDDFGARYAQAYQDRADFYFDQVTDIADGAAKAAELEADIAGRDVRPEHRAKIERRAYNEEIQARRLRIDSRKWALGRMNRTKYGDRTDHAVGGMEGAPPVAVKLKAPFDVKHLTKTVEVLREVLDGKGK